MKQEDWIAKYTAAVVIDQPDTRWVIVPGPFCKNSQEWRHIKAFDLYSNGTKGSKRVYHLTHNGERFADGSEFKMLREHCPDALAQIETVLRPA